MTLTVQLFGPYAKAAGEGQVSLTFADGDVVLASQVLAKLKEDYPPLEPLLGVARLAVNCSYVAGSHEVVSEDELAVIGMVGGG